MEKSVRVLHTSDWHLGLKLNNNDREEEFKRFLEWLKKTIDEEKIDVLIVAGDIFDVAMPKNSVQKLYYRFLSSLQSTCCRHTVIVAGNHDSPTLLSAPADVLEAINVKVVGSLPEDIADEVFVLDGDKGRLIVGAVPYLRSGDIAKLTNGEDFNLDEAVNKGIREHYAKIAEAVEAKQPQDGDRLPVLITGHLFAQGGVQSEGERELYIGNLKGVDSSAFPECADYVALGHLHKPQTVGVNEFIRYSGSPLQVGFNEAEQQKHVCAVEFTYGNGLPTQTEIRTVNIPKFRELRQILGDKAEIFAELERLKEANPKTEAPDEFDIWLEIVHTGSDIWPTLAEDVNERCEGSRLKVIISKDQGARDRELDALEKLQRENQNLEDLDVYQVFALKLQADKTAPEVCEALNKAYAEIVKNLDEQDFNA